MGMASGSTRCALLSACFLLLSAKSSLMLPSSLRSSGLMYSNSLTASCTPGIPATTLPARAPSWGVTRPCKYTTPRSVVTIMVRVGTPLVLISLDKALVVIQVSLERTPSSVGGPTRNLLITCTTLSMWATSSPALVLMASVGTSPVSSTRPAYELTLTRPGSSVSSKRVSLLALRSMALSSSCSPAVRRSTATTAVVVAAPPISTGAQALSRLSVINRVKVKAIGLRNRCQAIIKALRVIGCRCHRTWHAAARCAPLGCAWCDYGAHIGGCQYWPKPRQSRRRHCQLGR